MKWSIARDGRWAGLTFDGAASDLGANVPSGCSALPGDPRALLASGDMLPPEPPPTTELVSAWTWCSDALQYLPTPSTAAIARDMRAERDRRLTACDWTQLPDVPAATGAAWAAYRQALRDITDQPGWPTDITWPTPPTGA